MSEPHGLMTNSEANQLLGCFAIIAASIVGLVGGLIYAIWWFL